MDRICFVLGATPLLCAAFAAAVASDESVAGLVKELDAKAGTVTMTVRGEKSREDKTASVAKEARILINGNYAMELAAHSAVVEHRDSVIVTSEPRANPIRIFNAQDCRLTLDNVRISGVSPPRPPPWRATPRSQRSGTRPSGRPG